MNLQISFKLVFAILISVLMARPALAQFDGTTLPGWQLTSDKVQIGDELHSQGDIFGDRTYGPLNIYGSLGYSNGAFVSMYSNDGTYNSGSMVFATGLYNPGTPGSNPNGAGAFRFNGYNGSTLAGDPADFNSLFVISTEGFLGAGSQNPSSSLELRNLDQLNRIRISMDAIKTGTFGRKWNLVSSPAGSFEIETDGIPVMRSDIVSPPSPFTIGATPLTAYDGLIHVKNPNGFMFAQGYNALGENADPSIDINQIRMDVNGGMRVTAYNDPAKYYNVLHNGSKTILQSTDPIEMRSDGHTAMRADVVTLSAPYSAGDVAVAEFPKMVHVQNGGGFTFMDGYGALGEETDGAININEQKVDINGGMRLTASSDPAKYFNVVHNGTSTYMQSTGSIVLRAQSGKVKVGGILEACEVDVQLYGYCWPDYVFEKDYDLMPLSEVKAFVEENKHLPNIPAEAELVENGMKLGEMQALTMEKVEELTLYLIQMQERLDELEGENNSLKEQLSGKTTSH